MLRTIQAQNSDLLFIIYLSDCINLDFASVHNLLEVITIAAGEILRFYPVHKSPKF